MKATLVCVFLCGLSCDRPNVLLANEAELTNGWQTASVRAEVRPAFSVEERKGREGKSALLIQHDAREGLDGFWTKTFPVPGGKFYRFQAFRKTDRVASPRQSAMVRVLWQDDAGRKVLRT